MEIIDGDDVKCGWSGFLDMESYFYMYRLSHMLTSNKVVIKQAKKADFLQSITFQEREVLNVNKYDNIMELLKVYYKVRYSFSTLEHCNKGNFGTFFTTKNPSSQEKLQIMYKCAFTVNYLHSQKLSIANEAGALAFRAPEVLTRKDHNHQHSHSVDVFALGMIFKAILDYGSESKHFGIKEVSIKGEDDWMTTYAMTMHQAKLQNRKSPALFVMRADDDDLMLLLKVLVTNMTAYDADDRPDIVYVKNFLGILGQNKSHNKYTETWVELHSEVEQLRKENIEIRESHQKHADQMAQLWSTTTLLEIENKLLQQRIEELNRSQTDVGDLHSVEKPDSLKLEEAVPLDFVKQEEKQSLQQQPTSEIFIQKLLELENSIKETVKKYRETTEVKELAQSCLMYKWKQHIEGPLKSLHDIMSVWDKENTEKPDDQFETDVKAVDVKPKRDYDLDKLDENYNLLLKDLESNDDDDDFIQAVYKDHQANKVVVEVNPDRYADAEDMIKHLPENPQYQNYLHIVTSDPIEHLMHQQFPPHEGCDQHPLLIGNGSYIAVINKPEQYLNELLKDASVKSVRNIEKEAGGTLTCICGDQRDFYAMTAQHVLDEENSHNNKHIISEVQYQSTEIHLADIIHLSSSHFGKLGVIQDEHGRNRAVDVALMRINQRWLDRGLLKPIPVFTRSHFEALCPNDKNLIGKEVKKFGAVTMETTGEIINDDCSVVICPRSRGKMFAVACPNGKVFAESGDSGALVTMDIEGEGGMKEEYALGIVSLKKNYMLGKQNVTLCVLLEDCLKALHSVDGTRNHLAIKLYRGFLKPAISITDRREPHKTTTH